MHETVMCKVEAGEVLGMLVAGKQSSSTCASFKVINITLHKVIHVTLQFSELR